MISFAKSRWIITSLCLLGGIAVGVSGFSSDSNHPTYVPPALHYLDSRYFTGDWWVGSARHYHFAFFAVAAALAKLGVLEIGLAVLNILAVASALYACFLIIEEITRRSRITIFVIFIAAFLMTRTFHSLGASYLFTPSLQPSSLAATATLLAIVGMLRRRLMSCGMWLGMAGLFHVNFLVVNIPFFATAYFLTIVQEPRPRATSRDFAIGLLALVGPSLLLLALFAPLVLNVGAETLSPAQSAAADWIFFGFAVPFHYFPLTYLDQLYPFFCWEAVGLLWTSYAVSDPAQRRVAWAIQIAFALVIWSATALTTIVFVPVVARLFLWRLAPFAVLFSALMTIVGTVLATDLDKGDVSRKDRIVLAISFVLLPTLFVPATPLAGQIVSTHGLWLAAAVLGILLLRVGLQWEFGLSLRSHHGLTGGALVALLLVAVVTQPSDGKQSRYSLIVQSPELADERDLFAFVRRSTPRDAQFLTPPDLDYFRLEGERATIVDLKAMPINKSGLIEWYRRLADVSGVNHPANTGDVITGFGTLDNARINRLRKEYGITYIVTRAGGMVRADGWNEVFRNRTYRVTAYRGLAS